MTRPPLPSESEHAARIAELALQCRLVQHLPWHATERLVAIVRQDPGIAPAEAHRVATAALVACIEVEIRAARRAA